MSSTQNGSPQLGGDPELETGPYLLRPLLSDIALNESGEKDDTFITCVEHWNDNIYVGTSKGELLHFVCIPPADGESQSQKTFIQAFRFHPVSNGKSDAPNVVPGIQQILVLPTALKACILCNGTLTFYTLPELTPAFGSLKVPNCTWVGGINQNATAEELEEAGGVEVLVCLRNRMRIVKLGDAPKRVGDIEIGGCIVVSRRDHVACVADGRSYSLLDVVEKQMIPLFEISSLGNNEQNPENEQPEESQPAIELTDDTPADSSNPQQDGEPSDETIPITAESDAVTAQDQSEQKDEDGPAETSFPPRSSSIAATEAPIAQSRVEEPIPTNKKELSSTPRPLVPHVLSPTAEEFLLTTGTSFDEPGVGMFVNMEGDLVPRATIEFSRYPRYVVLDGQGIDDPSMQADGSLAEEGFVLALIKGDEIGQFNVIEIQRWDVDPSETGGKKHRIDISRYASMPKEAEEDTDSHAGIRQVASPTQVTLAKVVEVLALRPVPHNLFPNLTNPPPTDNKPATDQRQKEEQLFIERLSNMKSQLVVWANDVIWNAVRNPLVLRLEAQLQLSTQQNVTAGYTTLDRQKVEFVINDIRGQEPNNELEFFALKFVRQKASLLLFLNLVYRTIVGQNVFDRDTQLTEEVLFAGEIDPRLVLAAVPSLREEIVIGSEGLWVQGGLVNELNDFMAHQDLPANLAVKSAFGTTILPMVKRFLFSWRRKKGFGSITDETAVFQSVDASILRLLLLMDDMSVRGPAVKGSVRSELYNVVDRGVDGFDRAVALLEEHKRLYVLSRLYQSRKMASQVLTTWKRILEGEDDACKEFLDGETEVRKYLRHLKDSALVQEYGCWLAKRNPKLGVQVFADENSRVKFQPKQAVDILKGEAPAAVKEYLEYLVFGKKLPQYADDLVGYYFDSVIQELEDSTSTKHVIMQTYEKYRSLELPKPTYAQFIVNEPIEGDWWRNRIRLLQLLGGSHGATSQINVETLLSRIIPYEKELVPELIILYGRQGRHTEAIRLLTHGLGDFDTAVSYCVMGGSSTYSQVSGVQPKQSVSTKQEQEDLFKDLLGEFLRIEDSKMRMNHTSELLERYASWFDIEHVLGVVPDSWPVDSLLGFLENRFRQLISERNQSAIERALMSVQNLGLSSKLIEKVEAIGPIVQELQQSAVT